MDVEKIAGQQQVGRVVDSEFFFLLLGVDQNEGEATTELTRSDTIMLVNLCFDEGKIDLISLPRDSYVDVDGWNEKTKLNHSHSTGGVDLTIQTISNWLEIDLDYYVEVNFTAVRDIVDAMGGITYEIPDDGIRYEYVDSQRKTQVLQPGKQVLNGEQSLAYLRFRKGYITGDAGRVEAQQKYMKAFVKQALSSSNIVHLPNFAKTFFDKVKTNIDWSQIVGLLGQAQSLKDAQLTTYTIPGEGQYIGNVSYYIPDEEKARELIETVLPNYRILHWQEEEERDASKEETSIENVDGSVNGVPEDVEEEKGGSE